MSFTIGIDPGFKNMGIAVLRDRRGRLPSVEWTRVVRREASEDAVAWCRACTLTIADEIANVETEPLNSVSRFGIEAYHWMGPRSANKQGFEMAGIVRWIESWIHSQQHTFTEVRKVDANSSLGLKGKCDDKRIKRAVEASFGWCPSTPHERDAILAGVAAWLRRAA